MGTKKAPARPQKSRGKSAPRTSVDEAPSTDALTEKRALLDELRRQLSSALEVMVAAAHTAREAATHPEMKPENDKDTRGIEAGYLAVGQSARAAELQRALLELATASPPVYRAGDPVGLLALLDVDEELQDHVQRLRLFLCPWGAGMKLRSDRGEVQVVTPSSPLGQALVGKRVGDVAELRVGGRLRELELMELR